MPLQCIILYFVKNAVCLYIMLYRNANTLCTDTDSTRMSSYSLTRAVTESQNPRMVDVGRDLWKFSGSTCLLNDGHLQLGPRTVSSWVLNISKDEDSITSLCNLCQCLVILTAKKSFLTFRGNFLCFSLCPLPLVLSPLKRAWLCPHCTIALSLQVFVYIEKILLSLLFSRMNSPTFLSQSL